MGQDISRVFAENAGLLRLRSLRYGDQQLARLARLESLCKRDLQTEERVPRLIANSKDSLE